MTTPEQANPPIWKDGDVIAYTFKKADGTAGPKEYTYARVDGYWPGERDWSSLSDEDVTDAWSEGRAYLMRSGIEEAELPLVVNVVDPDVITLLRISNRRLRNAKEILEDWRHSSDPAVASLVAELQAVLGG